MSVAYAFAGIGGCSAEFGGLADPGDAGPPTACTAPTDCDGLRCVDGLCDYYPDCRGLLESGLAPTSGSYPIRPDGAPGPILATCDMTTDGGGWTLVFLTSTPNHNRNITNYTELGAGWILEPATQALLAYRDPAEALAVTAGTRWARIDLPDHWKSLCPTEARGRDTTVLTLVEGDAAPTLQVLRYGLRDFDDTCDSGWDTSEGSDWGRICIRGSEAPFFNAFDSSFGDFCPHSSQPFNAVQCGANRRFSIAVR